MSSVRKVPIRFLQSYEFITMWFSVGMSTSTQEQLFQILTVVTNALSSVSAAHRRAGKKASDCERRRHLNELETERRVEAIRYGTWHDGRIDCVAGNGLISELGVGIENFDEEKASAAESSGEKRLEVQQQNVRAQEDIDAVGTLPIIVLKNFSTTSKTSPIKDEVLGVLAQWVASLVENKVCD